jgi:hypothetical protein
VKHIYLAEKLREFTEADLALKAARGQMSYVSRPGLARLLADGLGRLLVLWGSRLQEWSRTRQPDSGLGGMEDTLTA